MSDEVEQRFPAKQRKKKILTTGSQTKVTWFKKYLYQISSYKIPHMIHWEKGKYKEAKQ